MAQNNGINFNLSSIADGGLQEKVDRALAKVAENILDPNTDATKKRKVTVNITLAPNEDRYSVSVSTDVKTMLAPETGVGTTLLVGKDHGKPVANELKSGAVGQTYIDDEGKQRTDTGEPIEQAEQEDAVKQVAERQDDSDKVINFQKGKEA